MQNLAKYLRRFVGGLLLTSFLIIAVNIIVLVVIMSKQTPSIYPWRTAEEVLEALTLVKNEYVLAEEVEEALKRDGAWAIYIDNNTQEVVWQTDNLPESIPKSFSLSAVAQLTRGYLDGYPTFTGEGEKGLVVLGYPKDRFWKHMWPSWDYSFIANFPKMLLAVFFINLGMLFIIYLVANTQLLRSIKPITNGIQTLPTGEPVYIKEKGLLAEIASNINRTSEILQEQKIQLRRKENARANWIAGVSHDIRTPLSVVMGYGAQLSEDASLKEEHRQKAKVIVKQSKRMKSLINDLNLASKLEYNMQPVNLAQENLVALTRQVVVDFMNLDLDSKYPIEWETDEDFAFCPVMVDKELLKRAISNLLQNSMNHNEQGCTIYVRVEAAGAKGLVTIADNGVGVSEEELNKLNNTPHYLICDENTTEQRHGLGLLIVKQILAAHQGTVTLGHSSYGGFAVELSLPLLT